MQHYMGDSLGVSTAQYGRRAATAHSPDEKADKEDGGNPAFLQCLLWQ